MDSNRFQPVGGNHAIEVMAIGIEWASRPLDDSQLALLQKVYQDNTAIKTFLPTLAPMQAFIFQAQHQFAAAGQAGDPQVTPQEIAPPQLITRNGGFDLQRIEPSGNLSWVVSIRPEFISVNCTAYDRWKNVKPQALEILQPFVEAVMAKGATIAAVGLQYQDAFKLLDGASPVVSNELFRNDGKFLPTYLLEQPSFWHCHQGWFSVGPDSRRILNNIATEVADANGVHFARIGGQHRVHATSIDGVKPMPINANEIDPILECLHKENINVINRLLSDSALKKIGCTGGAHGQ